jgi:hypothetical protein
VKGCSTSGTGGASARLTYHREDGVAEITRLLDLDSQPTDRVRKSLKVVPNLVASFASPDLILKRDLGVNARLECWAEPPRLIELVDRAPQEPYVLLRNELSPRPLGHGFQRNALTEALELTDKVLR